MESEVDLLKCFKVNATPAWDKEGLSGSRDPSAMAAVQKNTFNFVCNNVNFKNSKL